MVEPAQLHDVRLQTRQATRLQVLLSTVGSYAIDAFWLTICALAGMTMWYIPLGYALLAGLACAVFFYLISTGKNLKLKDHDLTLPQLVVGYGLQLLFLCLAPQIGFIFVATLFVVSSFGALAMRVKQFAVTWVVVSVILTIILTFVGDHLAVPVQQPLERFLVALVIVSILGRVALLNFRVSALRDSLAQSNRELKWAIQRTEELAATDSLTQALNRRALMQSLETERLRTQRTGSPFSIVMMDVDHFKNVNDCQGHLVGDEVLKKIVDLSCKTLRTTDRLARYGGEEFVVLLPDTSLEGAVVAAERIRQIIEGYDWTQIALELKITISSGVASYQAGDTGDQMLARGDSALYKAKRNGRNCVVVG